MAKFNTLAGGYYGKLGATVGQRWKNLRTVRAYVVPHNPRTEVQQANRNRFSDCVFYAQLAGQMNAKVTCFDTTSKTLWNARMSTARALQDLEYSEMDRIPLYPESFSVPNQISSGAITNVIDETHIEVTVNGISLSEERVLTMLLILPGSTSWKERLALCVGSNGEEGGSVFTFRIPEGVTITSGIKARFISCDDTDSTTDLIASSQIDLPYSAPVTRTFDTTITSIVRNSMRYTVTFAEPYQVGTNAVGSVIARGVFNGAWRNWTISNAEIINNGGYFALTFETTASHPAMIPAFPSGSSLTISSISSSSATLILSAENVTESMSNDDLTRTYENTITSVERDGNTFKFMFDYNVPNSNSASGSWSFYCVKKGVFQTVNNPSATFYTDRVEITQSTSSADELYAFPSGSSVTHNITFVTNGVTYTPQTTTAQSISSSDLSRTMSPLVFSWSTTNQRWEAVWNANATITSGGGTRTATVKHHRMVFQKSVSSSLVIGFAGGTVFISSAEYTNNTPLYESDLIATPQAETFVANGVSYTLAIQEFGTEREATVQLNSADWDLSGSISQDGFTVLLDCQNTAGLSLNSQSANLEPSLPAIVELGLDDERTIDVDVDDATLNVPTTSYEIETFVSANCGGAGRDEGQDGSVALSIYPIELVDGNGNHWYLPQVDVELISAD